MSGADPVILLPRGVRLHDDRVRGACVLLGPERALFLDEIGEAILRELNGPRRLSEITVSLASRYAAPEAEIRGDVAEFLAGLRDKMLVVFRDE
jgi:pyrroloquinoline quinone biosynthesis protein D